MHISVSYSHFFPGSDSADKVVKRTGKFEELVVASHDIAASTAQLVAASRVKARPKSEKLKSLKASSRNGMCMCSLCSRFQQIFSHGIFYVNLQSHDGLF